jgi:peptide/nickel transport system substrate-binding protein
LDVIYDGLLTMRGSNYNDFAVAGQLVKSWEVSSAGTEWTFQLQDGVNWQNLPPVNGRPFTSDDVAWLIDWTLDKKPGKSYSAYKSIISHREPDAHTIVITTDGPQASFLANFAVPEGKVLPRELLEETEAGVTLSQGLAIGTGPFQFDTWRRGVSVKAVANPNYWQIGEDGKNLPYLDGWQTFTMKDYAARLAALKTGQVDRWYWPGGILTEDAADLRQNYPEWRIEKDYFVVGPNLASDNRLAPFDDVRVRRALALSVNRRQIIDLRFRGDAALSGYVNPARTEWSWSQDKIAETFPYDPDAARALLADAGYGGEEVTFVHYTGASPGFDTQTAEMVMEFMRQVGFNVKAELVPDYAAMSAKMNAGQAQVNLNACYGHTRDDQLWQWYHSTSPTNWVGANNPALDALLEQEPLATDPQERTQIVMQIWDIIAENVYCIPNVIPLTFRAEATWVFGLQQSRLPANYHRERVWIDRDLKP